MTERPTMRLNISNGFRPVRTEITAKAAEKVVAVNLGMAKRSGRKR